MANNVTTEWEDIHVKLGNYLPREKEKSNDELQKIAIESIQNYDPLEHKTLDQLKKMEEEDDDDEVIKAYEAKRLAELREFASKPKFGKVMELRKQDYIDEVTHAPKDVYVVLHLYQNSIEDSNVLGKIFDYLAKKYVLVKFMKIVSTNCIENFSDKDVPAVIIYQNGKLIRQFIPAVYYFGGSGHLSWQKVEWILGSIKVIKSDLEEDPFDEREHAYLKKHKGKYDDDDEEDEEEDEKDDREYSWKIYKK